MRNALLIIIKLLLNILLIQRLVIIYSIIILSSSDKNYIYLPFMQQVVLCRKRQYQYSFLQTIVFNIIPIYSSQYLFISYSACPIYFFCHSVTLKAARYFSFQSCLNVNVSDQYRAIFQKGTLPIILLNAKFSFHYSNNLYFVKTFFSICCPCNFIVVVGAFR